MATGLGSRIKKKRNELGISQTELAERMGLKSKSTVCKIERGDDNLTTDTISKYAIALHCTPAYLMGWEDDDGNPIEKEKPLLIEKFEPRDKQEALKLYTRYMQAIPEIRSAVDRLLNMPNDGE